MAPINPGYTKVYFGFSNKKPKMADIQDPVQGTLATHSVQVPELSEEEKENIKAIYLHHTPPPSSDDDCSLESIDSQIDNIQKIIDSMEGDPERFTPHHYEQQYASDPADALLAGVVLNTHESKKTNHQVKALEQSLKRVDALLREPVIQELALPGPVSSQEPSQAPIAPSRNFGIELIDEGGRIDVRPLTSPIIHSQEFSHASNSRKLLENTPSTFQQFCSAINGWWQSFTSFFTRLWNSSTTQIQLPAPSTPIQIVKYSEQYQELEERRQEQRALQAQIETITKELATLFGVTEKEAYEYLFGKRSYEVVQALESATKVKNVAIQQVESLAAEASKQLDTVLDKGKTLVDEAQPELRKKIERSFNRATHFFKAIEEAIDEQLPIELKNKVEEITDKVSQQFDELVTKGQAVLGEISDKLKEEASTVNKTALILAGKELLDQSRALDTKIIKLKKSVKYDLNYPLDPHFNQTFEQALPYTLYHNHKPLRSGDSIAAKTQLVKSLAKWAGDRMGPSNEETPMSPISLQAQQVLTQIAEGKVLSLKENSYLIDPKGRTVTLGPNHTIVSKSTVHLQKEDDTVETVLITETFVVTPKGTTVSQGF